jgi:hypothetical protein
MHNGRYSEASFLQQRIFMTNLKRIIGYTVVIVLAFCVTGLADTKSGPISLQESRFGVPEGATKIELGTTVKLVAQPHISEFFGRKIINAGASVENTSSKPMFYAFNIAFFDKDNQLLGCVSQGAMGTKGIEAGQKFDLGSCIIPIPPEQLQKVASYQATFYESDSKI